MCRAAFGVRAGHARCVALVAGSRVAVSVGRHVHFLDVATNVSTFLQVRHSAKLLYPVSAETCSNSGFTSFESLTRTCSSAASAH